MTRSWLGSSRIESEADAERRRALQPKRLSPVPRSDPRKAPFYAVGPDLVWTGY